MHHTLRLTSFCQTKPVLETQSSVSSPGQCAQSPNSVVATTAPGRMTPALSSILEALLRSFGVQWYVLCAGVSDTYRRRLVCIREMPSYCARHNDIGEGVGMRTRRASVGVHWVSELPIETTSIQRMLTGTRCISRTSKRTSSHSTTWYQRHTVSWRHKTEGKAREGSALPWQPATVLVVAKGRCAREGLGAQSRHHRSETCAGLLLGDSGSKAARHTVPWIWKKGRPALVCQLWGDCAQQRRR